jgi:alpha-tubulin suppressor-like RCC1 family protein
MRSLSPALCLMVLAGSSGGCVAATRMADTEDSAPPDGGSQDAGPKADSGAEVSVEAALPEVDMDGGRDEARVDASVDHIEAGKAESGVDAGHMSEAGDGGFMADSGSSCPTGETLCGVSCVDTQTDPSHCGDCSTACSSVPDGEATCSAGTCGFTCDSDYHACGAACDSNNSLDSCGSSCAPCPAPPINGTAICDGTSCGFTCNPGTVFCAGGTECCTSEVLAAGDAHTCFLSSGAVTCVGEGSSGQLGDGSTKSSATSVVFTLGTSAVSVVAGCDHTCALTVAGTVYCSGDNASGDLGDGSTTTASTAVFVTDLGFVAIAIAAGDVHTCALLANGGVECWGNNGAGQLGDGTTANASTAQPVSGLSGAVGIAAGSEHTCAVTSAGTVWCWGQNSYGQVGNTSVTSSTSTPVEVTGLSGAVSVTAGARHTCALTEAGAVWCWGYGADGELGDGSTASSGTPVEIPPSTNFGGSVVMAISAGAVGYETCALTAAGGVWCWGDNVDGGLGDGTLTSRSTPVEVSGLPSGAIAISTGDYFACAQISGEGNYCWGSNADGELGTGGAAGYSAKAVKAPQL